MTTHSAHTDDDATGKELDVASIIVTALVGIAVLVITILLLEAYFYGYNQRLTTELGAVPSPELLSARTTQWEQLQHYSPPDAAKGTMTIPIDRAMELVVKDAATGGLPPAAPGAARAAGSATPPTQRK